MPLETGDLGLTYDEALHGIQTAVLYEMGGNETSDRYADLRKAGATPKHLRVGINSAHVTDCAIARLLINIGIITEDEYVEAVRLAMNQELARYEARYPGIKFR